MLLSTIEGILMDISFNINEFEFVDDAPSDDEDEF